MHDKQSYQGKAPTAEATKYLVTILPYSTINNAWICK